MLCVLVPEVECAVATGCAEGTMNGVEADRVDGVDVADVAVGRWSLTVALEGEVEAVVLVLDVLNSTTTFNTTHRKSRGIAEAANHSSLPFKRRLHSLVEFGRVVEVNDVDVTISGANDQELILDIHRVDSLLAIDVGDGSLLSQIPVFDSLIPGASHEER